jgi:hypothetical protein
MLGLSTCIALAPSLLSAQVLFNQLLKMPGDAKAALKEGGKKVGVGATLLSCIN